MTGTQRLLPVLFVLAVAPRVVRADEVAEPARSYTLEQAVVDSLAKHPRITASLAEETASAARVDEAQARRLPDVGVSGQLNRSTGNTVPGAFFPLVGVVPIAGPTRGRSLDEGAWQTGASVWGTWDVLSLARQAAAVDVAIAAKNEAAAATAARRLEIAYRAADAHILLLEAQEGVRAARASVERAQVLAAMTRSLVDQALRPGADAARTEAEVASAQTSLARADQLRDVRRAQLAEAVGDTALRAEAAPSGLLAPVDAIAARAAAPSPSHPDIRQSDAIVAREKEAQRLVDVQYLPRVDLVAALWTRGSGLFDSPGSGLVPDVANWAAGATVTWSFLDIPTIRARAKVAAASRAAAMARRDETILGVAGQLATSTAILRGSLAVARQTPLTLAAARAAEQQATARFKTGLTPVVEVAEADRVLAQAEIDEAVARLEVRRALLLLARASGDLEPFLRSLRAGAR